MKRKRSERIARIYTLARTEERRVCREMGESQRRLDEEMARLEDLRAYRQSYGGKQPASGSVAAVRWQDYRNFLTRLDQAVEAQDRVVQGGEEQRDAHRRRWMAKRQRLESLERVVDRYRKLEGEDLRREMQKAQDDLTQNSGRYRKP